MFNFCTNPHLTVSNEVEILYEIQESDKSEINNSYVETRLPKLDDVKSLTTSDILQYYNKKQFQTIFEYSPPNQKPIFLNPQSLQKVMVDECSPSDLASKIVTTNIEKEKSMEKSLIEDSNLKSILVNFKIKTKILAESSNHDEVEIPMMESKINKNLYADYIVKLKRLPVKERKKIEKKMIKEFIYDETDSVQYYLNIDWAVEYTNYLDDPKNLEIKPINNYALLDKDYMPLKDIEENTHFVLVNEKTWIFVVKIYDGGPAIKLKSNGQIIVSNNEAILFSSMELLHANSPNEKIKGIFNSSEQEEEKQPLLTENKEEILDPGEKLIKFDKTKDPRNYKKLKILTNHTNTSNDYDNPQSSTSLDSHSTSFSKDDLLGSDKKKRTMKIFGLANNSNYCFLNSGLQCLFTLETLNDYFLSEKYKENKGKTIKPPKYINIYSDALKLINAFESQSNAPNKKSHSNFVNAANLFKSILKKVFNPREQQDIHEFIRLFLSEIQDELNPILDKRNSSILAQNSDGRWESHLKNNPSIIDYLFSSQMKTKIQCLECKKTREIYEIFLDFSVPIVKITETNNKKDPKKPAPKEKEPQFNIYHCLNKFFEEEIIAEYKCPFCKKTVKSKKQMTISKSPKILLIHFKRFKTYPRKQKISDKIDFPFERLDMKNYCSNNEPNLYNLKCFASHIGTEDYGHYVAFALRNYKWYFFNDEEVKPINEADIPKREAYLMFYEKIE